MKRPVLHGVKIPVVIFLLFMLSKASAQKWDTLASIPEPFTFPVVDTLGGKIHIVGGGGTGGATDHHYAYDPATDTWEEKAPVPYRAQQPAGASVNGKLHFFGGGFPNTGSPVDDHFVYDPQTDEWTQAADLTSPRAIHYGIALNNNLYTMAGQGKANVFQRYDAVEDQWIMQSNLPDNAFWYGAHVSTEGHIYRFCGGGYTAPNANANRYDPETDDWSDLPDFPDATHGIKGAAIGHHIFLVGGYHSFLERDEVWIFDTQTEEYTAGIPMPLGRNYHNVVALDSCLYVVGGNHALDESVRTQLIRICPFEQTTGINGMFQAEPLRLGFQAGELLISLPEELDQHAGIAIHTLSGLLVYSEKWNASPSSQIRINGVSWAPGMYVVSLKSEPINRVGKIVIP